MLILNAADVRDALPMADCIDVMARALVALTVGDVVMPLRSGYRPPGADRKSIGWMPAFRMGSEPAFGAKLLCLVADNAGRGLDTHQGLVVVFDGETGIPTAVVDASALTSIRTAAVSALATRELARSGATHVALVGAGVQARAHLESISQVLELEQVTVASRTPESAEGFAREMAPRIGCPIEPTASVERAVRDADVVVTATTATTPVLDRPWVRPGTHINAVGMAFEIDPAIVAAAELYADRRESIAAEAREYRAAIEHGLIAPDHVRAELGEVLLGAPGRSSPDAITLFRSLGLACEDLYAAERAVVRARELGLGQEVTL